MHLCPSVLLIPIALYLYLCDLDRALNRILFFVLMLGLGFLAGALVPWHDGVYPLPHQIPKYPDVVSLRFAMVHDVLHDRYPRHGKAYYQERNRQILAQLAQEPKDADDLPPPAMYPLLDDLGVGYDLLGQPAEGARVLRAKLKGQLDRGMKGRELYTTYANLGTFIIHAHMAQARLGTKESTEQVREGLGFIRKSIEVNPKAHFGREVWQAVVAEFLLATAQRPELLLKYDMVGNRLDNERYHWNTASRFAIPRRGMHDVLDMGAYAYTEVARCARDRDCADRERLRGYITRVGAEEGWPFIVSELHTKPVAFDEPVLGIIGMWRLGGGANPHFALALGEIMRAIGQKRLAWCAYARAIHEADRFSPDAKTRADFVALCEKRQQAVPTPNPNPFEAELKHGQQYQAAYQHYEEEQIAVGRPLDDAHFYDAFHAAHAPIASPVGDADFMEVNEPVGAALSLLFAGFFCLLGGAWLWWRKRLTA